MKVSELQQQLGKFNPNLEVLCYTEDARFVKAGTKFTLLDIDKVTVIQGERVRLDDGTPTLKLGKSHDSIELVALESTSDF